MVNTSSWARHQAQHRVHRDGRAFLGRPALSPQGQGSALPLRRWEIPGRPRVILVDFNGRHDSNQILRQLWERFGVDSLSGGWDYVEPVLFSYTCGEVIATIHQVLSNRNKSHGIAHFHEWMCGAGILALKQLAPSMGTVFTTHATVLGRAMAGSGVDIYARMSEISPSQEAYRYNVTAKCSMETVSAREADVFTTVSGITAEEARVFLGRTPDVITDNGLDLSSIRDYSADRDAALANRARLLEPVSRLLRRKNHPRHPHSGDLRAATSTTTRAWISSSTALARAKQSMQNTSSKVLALMLMMGGHTGVDENAVTLDRVFRRGRSFPARRGLSHEPSGL